MPVRSRASCTIAMMSLLLSGALVPGCVGPGVFWRLGRRVFSFRRPGIRCRIRLRLDGVVYPVVLNRELDQSTLDRVWAARLRKLQNPSVHARQPGDGDSPALDTPRPDSWWSFRVDSRT